MPSLDKIGHRICEVLVKLAEIAYMEGYYRESEQTCDAIIGRNPPQAHYMVFAFLMKSLFADLNRETQTADHYREKANALKSGCKVGDLDLFAKVRKRA
jgi:hypothetical protein